MFSIDSAGRALATVYATYLGLLGMTGMFGLQLLLVVMLLAFMWRRNYDWRLGRRARPYHNLALLELCYGFVNPLIYLLIFQPYGAFRARTRVDAWLDVAGWTLFVMFWGARVLIPGAMEASPAVRQRLARLCEVCGACIVTFGLMDLVYVWVPMLRSGQSGWASVHFLIAFAPLYLVPLLLLIRYRLRLWRNEARVGLLLLSSSGVRLLAVGAAMLVAFMAGLAVYRPNDTAARARVARLAPIISDVAGRYGVDPKLLAAIVYVTERDQIGPFRDQVERFAMKTFLFDSDGEMRLARPFDLSIGAAQIKPLTALTALQVCHGLGQPWELQVSVRERPKLGPEWQLPPGPRPECQPPVVPVPVNKLDVVTALLQDDANLAFAAYILGLYQLQWRETKPEWDISTRPDILATLYQIGFEKSRPHQSPRSNAFGTRVAEVYGQRWLQERFDGARIAACNPECRIPNVDVNFAGVPRH